MSNKNETTPLAAKVAEFKLIARNSLRMSLISSRLSRVASLEDSLTALADSRKEVEHEIAVETYEISKLDTGHPNYETTKTEKEDSVKHLGEHLTSLDEDVVETTKLLTEQKEAIAKIESGETKVSLDSLNDLVAEMVRANAVSLAV